jgi:voltage-gated potassium channel
MLMAVPIPVIYAVVRFLRLAFYVLRALLRNDEARGLLFLLLAIVTIGVMFYHRVEGWSLLDSYYYTVITLTTVGYGDLAPTTAAGKLFTTVYILMGLGIFAAFISLLAKTTIDEFSKAADDHSLRLQSRRTVTSERDKSEGI